MLLYLLFIFKIKENSSKKVTVYGTQFNYYNFLKKPSACPKSTQSDPNHLKSTQLEYNQNEKKF